MRSWSRRLVVRGAALCDIGRTYEGLALMEASRRLAVQTGDQLQALIAIGQIAAYQGGDPRAALQAEREALELARRLGRRTIVMTNTMNAAEDAIRTGEWDWAYEMVDQILGEDLGDSDRANALGVRITQNALRGEDTDALMTELERCLSGEPGRHADYTRADVRATIAWTRGDLAEAARHYRTVASLSPLNAPYVLPRAARAALWGGDAGGAAEDLAAFEATGTHGPATPANRTTIRAGLAAIDGNVPDAAVGYRQALAAWRDLGLPWDMALTIIDMAELLGPEHPDVRAVAPEAQAILEGLGARPFLARLEAALARPAASAASTATTPSSTIATTTA